MSEGGTTEGLPVAPSLAETRVPAERALVDRRVVFICALAVVIALAAGCVAQILTRLIAPVTNISFFGRVTTAPVSPADNHLGPWVMLVPIGGAIMVGLMARYGSAAIRGHGIPEAMEQVLLNKSPSWLQIPSARGRCKTRHVIDLLGSFPGWLRISFAVALNWLRRMRFFDSSSSPRSGRLPAASLDALAAPHDCSRRASRASLA